MSLGTAVETSHPQVKNLYTSGIENANLVALSPLSIIVNGVATPSPPNGEGLCAAPSITVGGQPIAISQTASIVILRGQTLAPGGTAITVSNVPVWLS